MWRIAKGTLTKDITATAQHVSSGLVIYSQKLKAKNKRTWDSLDSGVDGKFGATENAGVENAIRSKLQGWKMQEWKMQE